ncbi:MAG: C_GCAxxG_C_C family protein [Firmicutes bacterium]|nr:C_GCAxxG_C_C family protein [Bacillota bacterium]
MKPAERAAKAAEIFEEGYNCAQSVVLAFADELEIEPKTLAKLASSFGGGMGRLREVCGAVSGMFLVYGMLQGYSEAGDTEGKKKQYKEIQAMAAAFEKKHGSIVCRELLKKPEGPDSYEPAARTDNYYASRPCTRCVADAAEILESFLRK